MIQTKQVWRCDICRICTFTSFQEACDHEAQCSPPSDVTLVVAEEESSPTVADHEKDSRNLTSSEIHPLMRRKKRPFDENGSTASSAIEIPSSNSKREARSSSRVSRRKRPDEEDKEVEVIEAPLANIFTKKKETNRASNMFTKKPEKNRASVSSRDESLSSTSKTTSAKKSASANKKRSKTSVTQPALLEWLSCVPEEGALKDESSSSAFLTEQVAAYQFMEQRRLKQQNEREKIQRQQQRRREQELLNGTATTNVTCDELSETPQTLPIVSSRIVKSSTRGHLWAVRFPNPSHVFAVPGSDGFAELTEQEVSRNWWEPVPRPQPERCPQEVVPPFLASSAIWDEADLLQRTIRLCLISSTPRDIEKSFLSVNDGQNRIPGLWSDRYYSGSSNQLTTDSSKKHPVYFGASQRLAQDQLKCFIERFMMERQKIEELSKEKQKRRVMSFLSQGKRTKSCKKKPNSHRSKVDDDLWDDDYDSEDGVPRMESSLCLLSGPVGCGKSHLVHAIAKRLGCRKVVELHTGMRRNAASIKRLIEEATKSHSTFDMIHNRNSVTTAPSTMENVEPVRKVRHRKIITSDSEESDDEERKIEMEDRGSAVTVILIDEVDNLDPSTDQGFWTALSDLCKQSKCPIVCTASRVPSELKNSSSFGWIHIPLERPTTIECAHHLREICSMEGLTLRPHCSKLFSTDPWQVIAELGNCDMRRLLHELQSFKLGAAELAKSMEELCLIPNNDRICHTPQSFAVPRIESVRPRSLPMNEYCLLIIKGSHFCKLVDPNHISDHGCACEVFIGNVLCPESRILDDSTVLTVAPPLQFPRRLEPKTSKFRNLYAAPSYSLNLAPVRVCGRRKFGLTSSTDVSVETLTLPDLTEIYVATSPYLLEYRHTLRTENEESECENEFGVDNLSQNGTTSKFECASSPLLRNNDAVIAKLLDEGINSWRSTITQDQKLSVCVHCSREQSVTLNDVQALDDMCAKVALASDAALFEGITLTPCLSGACRGFGFDYTEEFPKRNNGNSKPPSEERLMMSGWKENCNFYGSSETHMVPWTSRERKLLHWHEHSIRGFSPIYAETLDSEESSDCPPLTSEITEEDFLFPIISPSAMLDLPRLLSTSSQPTLKCIKDEFSNRVKMKELSETLIVARDFIFAQPKYSRLLSRLLSNPILDPRFRQNEIAELDLSLCLDYLPLLRCMAVQERVSEYIFQVQERSNDASLSKNHGRRVTRRSLNRGREQYFDSIVPSHVFEDSNKTAKDIVELFANKSLLYKR